VVEMCFKRCFVGVLVVALAVSTLLIFTVDHAEAYTVKPHDNRLILIYIRSDSDAYNLVRFPERAADKVLNEARRRGFKVERSKASIVGEIRAHAIGYLYFGCKGEPANPMGIELWPAPWWYYLLD
jgi:hypothetical protein